MDYAPLIALPSRKFVWGLRLLCLVALAISSYLAWSAFQQSEVYGCGGGEVWDCGHVLHSPWAKWFGMPVSLPAAAMYSSVLVALAVCTMSSHETARQLAWAVVTVGALSAGIAAIWFISIQVFVLKKLCIYCMCAHCCGLILSAVILWRRPLGRNMTSAMSGLSVVGACVLIAGQLLAPAQKTYAEERYNTVDFTNEDGDIFSLDFAEEDDEFLFEPTDGIFAVPSDEAAPDEDGHVSASPPSAVEPQSKIPVREEDDDTASPSAKSTTSVTRSLLKIVSRYTIQLAEDITAELSEDADVASREDPCFVAGDPFECDSYDEDLEQELASTIPLESEMFKSGSNTIDIVAGDGMPTRDHGFAMERFSESISPDERQQGLDEIAHDLAAMGVGGFAAATRQATEDKVRVDDIVAADAADPQADRQSAKRLRSILIKDEARTTASLAMTDQSSGTQSPGKQETKVGESLRDAVATKSQRRPIRKKRFSTRPFQTADEIVVHDVPGRSPAPAMSPIPGDSSTAKQAGTASQQPSKRNLVAVLGGRAKLDARHWPLVGASDADYVLVELFDYTCPHCRKMNQHIREARRRYGDQLSIMTLPVPLSRECNDTVQTTKLRHQAACELARLAVAVWRISPEAFEDFHDWLFVPEHGRSTTEAWTYATQLVGGEPLRVQMSKPIINQFITKHVELYKRAGKGTVPKLMFPTVTIRGDMGSADALCQVLERELFNK